MLLSPLSLAFAIILYPVILFSWATPLNHDHDNGFLYRFSPASSNETEGLLSWAEVRRGFLLRPEGNRAAYIPNFFYFSC